MSDCAARPRWAAHRRVLSRPDSRAIEAPCVLALHSPIPPARRASFRFDLLRQAVIPTGGCRLAATAIFFGGRRDRRVSMVTGGGRSMATGAYDVDSAVGADEYEDVRGMGWIAFAGIML